MRALAHQVDQATGRPPAVEHAAGAFDHFDLLQVEGIAEAVAAIAHAVHIGIRNSREATDDELLTNAFTGAAGHAWGVGQGFLDRTRAAITQHAGRHRIDRLRYIQRVGIGAGGAAHRHAALVTAGLAGNGHGGQFGAGRCVVRVRGCGPQHITTSLYLHSLQAGTGQQRRQGFGHGVVALKTCGYLVGRLLGGKAEQQVGAARQVAQRRCQGSGGNGEGLLRFLLGRRGVCGQGHARQLLEGQAAGQGQEQAATRPLLEVVRGVTRRRHGAIGTVHGGSWHRKRIRFLLCRCRENGNRAVRG